MIATSSTSVTYDIIFVVHIMAAVATIIVFVAMRFSALAVARGADAATQASRFPSRRNWAARVLHVMPVTGFIMSSSGGSSVTLGHAWIIVGLLCYLAAAGHLEAKTLPEERTLSQTIARDGVAPPRAGTKLVRSVDVLLMLVAIAFVSMLVQF
ncbi:MAG: hypothetical protein JWM55_970 [Acidimicrobiaceae bacterium]|nr:hypothetical protein [Acidimicrobiaceae bacterium]